MDLTLLAQALQQAEAKSAASNPYAPLQQVTESVNWNPYNYSNTENAVGGGIKGLLSGLFGGLGDNYQAEQNKQIYNALPGIIEGNLVKPDDMDLSVFAPLEKAGTLFGIQKKQNAIEAKAQNESDYDKEIRKALLTRGTVIDPSGAKSISIFDPVKDKESEAAATARGKVKGENSSFEASGKANPDSPFEKKVVDLRNQFDKQEEVQNFKYVQRLSNQLVETLKNPDAVADPILAKMAVQFVEPKLAVNAGEAAGLAASTSIPQEWKGMIAKALDGKSGLPQDVRQGLLQIAKSAYTAHGKAFSKPYNLYKEEADKFGIPIDRISNLGEPTSFEAFTGSGESDHSSDQKAAMASEAKILIESGKSPAEAAQLLRNKYSGGNTPRG